MFMQVFDGQLKFTVKQYGSSTSVTVASPGISDGKWHNATVNITGIWLAILELLFQVLDKMSFFQTDLMQLPKKILKKKKQIKIWQTSSCYVKLIKDH